MSVSVTLLTLKLMHMQHIRKHPLYGDTWQTDVYKDHSTLHVQVSRGPNWSETVDSSSTYQAGPAEPVWHAFGTNESASA